MTPNSTHLKKLLVYRLVKNFPHYHIHKGKPLIHLLSHIYPLPIVPLQHFKIHSNIILPIMSTHFRLSHALRFPDQNSVCISLLFLSNSTLRTHFTDLDFISVIIFGEGYRRWNCSLCSFLHHRIFSLLLAQIFSLVVPPRTPRHSRHCRALTMVPDLLKQSNFFALCLPPNFQCSTILVKVLFLNLLVIFFLFLIAIFLSLATDKIWSLLHFLISSLNFGAQRLRIAFLR